MKDSYLDRTPRPIYALVFLLPLILLYELGSILINPEALSESLSQSQIRVVSFVWIQNILEFAGLTGRANWILTPLVVVIILLALQFTSKTSWRVRGWDIVTMAVECVVLAVPLIILSLIFNRSFSGNNSSASAAMNLSSAFGGFFTGLSGMQNPAGNRLFVDIVTGIGAGIYEELVFRLILICLLMLVFQDVLKIDRSNSIVLSVLISAALFSAHHHFFFVNGDFGFGEQFSGSRFFFRLLAGIYFAVLFAVRGFGIAAGTHAFYDIIAAVLNASFFPAQG